MAGEKDPNGNGVDLVAFNDAPVPGALTQVYLSSALKSKSAPESVERVAQTPPEFVEAVKELLLLSRPFGFS